MSSRKAPEKKKKSVNMKKKEDPRRKDCYSYAFRCNLNATISLIQDAKIREAHYDTLRKTPFWNLFEAILQNKLTCNICRKYDLDVIKIINTYNHEDHTFLIDGRDIKFTVDDLRYIFGITCGSIIIPKLATKKPDTPFVRRRFKDSQRITASELKLQVIEAAKGSRKTDIEDVARLLVLHTLLTLFFTTTSPKLSWDIVQYVEDLSSIQKYAWSSKIHKFLMDSVSVHFMNPEKVTGCVIALLTKLLKPLAGSEHSSLVLVKWDLGALHKKMKRMIVKERVLVEVEDEDDSTRINLEDESDEGNSNEQSIVPYRGDDIINDKLTSLFDAMDRDQTPKEETPENLYVSMKEEINKLRAENEDQKMRISSLESERRVLDSKILELEVHNITQRQENKNDNSVEAMKKEIDRLYEEQQTKIADFQHILMAKNHMISEHLKTIDSLKKQNSEICKEYESKIRELTEKLEMEKVVPLNTYHPMTSKGREGIMKRGDVVSPSSMVKRVKEKDRKSLQLPEYTYPKTRRQQQKRKTTEEESGITKEGQKEDPQEVICVDDVEERNAKKQRSPCPFSLNTSIGKMLDIVDRDALSKIHKDGGLMAVVWSGVEKNKNVCLDDINMLLMERDVSNFVIDSFTSILAENQRKMEVANKELKNISYFFPCLSLKLFADCEKDKRGNLIDNDLDKAGRGFNLLFFPLNHSNFHWTLLLFDKTNGEWYFYNSLRPRTKVTTDIFFKECNELKEYVETYYNQAVEGESGYTTQDVEILPMFYDRECPQQKSGSLDCGVYVCMYMKLLSDHGHHNERGLIFTAGESKEPQPTTPRVLPKTVSATEIRKFRVQLIRTFLTGQESCRQMKKTHQQFTKDDDFQN